MVMGFCIGGPFILEPPPAGAQSCCRRGAGAAQRVAPGERTQIYDTNMKGLGPDLIARGPDLMEMVDRFLTGMCRTNADFVFT